MMTVTADTTLFRDGYIAALSGHSRGSTLDLEGVFAAGTAKQFGVNVHTGNGQVTRIGYDTTTQTVFIDRTRSGDVTFDPTFGGVQSAPLST